MTTNQQDEAMNDVQLETKPTKTASFGTRSTNSETIPSDGPGGALARTAADTLSLSSESSALSEKPHMLPWASETTVAWNHSKLPSSSPESRPDNSITLASFSWSTMDESPSPLTLLSGNQSLMTLSFVVRSPLTISSGTQSPYTISTGNQSPFTVSSGTRSPHTISTGTRSPFTASSGTRSPYTTSTVSTDARSQTSSVVFSQDDDEAVDGEGFDKGLSHDYPIPPSDALVVWNMDILRGIFHFGSSGVPRPVVMQDIYPNRLSVCRIPPTSPRISSMHVPFHVLFPKPVKSDDFLLFTALPNLTTPGFTEVQEGKYCWEGAFDLQLDYLMNGEEGTGTTDTSPKCHPPEGSTTTTFPPHVISNSDGPGGHSSPPDFSTVVKLNSKDFFAVMSSVTIPSLNPMEFFGLLFAVFTCSGADQGFDSDDESDISDLEKELEDDSSYESPPKPRRRKKKDSAIFGRDNESRDDLDTLGMDRDQRLVPPSEILLGMSPRESARDDDDVIPVVRVQAQQRGFDQLKHENRKSRHRKDRKSPHLEGSSSPSCHRAGTTASRNKMSSAPPLNIRTSLPSAFAGQISPTTAFTRVSPSTFEDQQSTNGRKHDVALNQISSSGIAGVYPRMEQRQSTDPPQTITEPTEPPRFTTASTEPTQPKTESVVPKQTATEPIAPTHPTAQAIASPLSPATPAAGMWIPAKVTDCIQEERADDIIPDEVVDCILDKLADDIILKHSQTPNNERQNFLDHRRQMYLNLRAQTESSSTSDEDIGLRTTLSSFDIEPFDGEPKIMLLEFSNAVPKGYPFPYDCTARFRISQSCHPRTHRPPMPFEDRPGCAQPWHSCREERTLTGTGSIIKAGTRRTLPIDKDPSIDVRRQILLEKRAAMQAAKKSLPPPISPSAPISVAKRAAANLNEVNTPERSNTKISSKNQETKPAAPRLSSGPGLMETSGKILALKKTAMRRREQEPEEEEHKVLASIPSMNSVNTPGSTELRAMDSRQALNRTGKLSYLRKARGATAVKAFTRTSAVPDPKSPQDLMAKEQQKVAATETPRITTGYRFVPSRGVRMPQ